jgi:hypothetical protein
LRKVTSRIDSGVNNSNPDMTRSLARSLVARGLLLPMTISGAGTAAKPEIRCRPSQPRPQAMQFWDGVKALDAIRERLTTAFSTSPGG